MQIDMNKFGKLDYDEIRLICEEALRALSAIHNLSSVMQRSTQEAVWREMIPITDLLEAYGLIPKRKTR